MRAVVIVSLAFLSGAALAPGALAGDDSWDGYLSGGLGTTRFSSNGFSENAWVGELRGTIEHTFADSLGIQLDGGLNHQDFSFAEPGAYFNSLDFAVHGFYRQPGHWLFGAFAQYRDDRIGASGFGESFDRYFAGAEAQVYFNKFSVYGQLAYQSMSIATVSAGGWVGNLRVRYFVKPNWFVEGNGGFGTLAAMGERLETLTLGAGTEFRLGSAPIGAYLRYAHTRLSGIGSSDALNTDALTVGLKWGLDGRTLWNRETSGASLDPVAPQVLPIF